MQEALLRPAHPMPFGFGPSPLQGFGVRRLCSPSLLLPSGVPANPVAFGFGFGPSPLGFGASLLCTPSVLIPRGDGVFSGGGYTTPFSPSPTRASPRGATSPSTPSPARASPRGATSPSTPSPARASPRGATSPSTQSPARASPRGATPSSAVSRVDDDAAAAAASEHRMRIARLALQYQDAATRYQLCVTQLADTAREAAALRVENAELRVANNDLAGRFAMLGGSQGAAIALSQHLRRLHLGQMQPMPMPPPPMLLPMPHPASQGPPMLLPMPRPASHGPPMLLPMPGPASQGPPMLLPMPRPASQAPPMLLPMARPASPAEKLAVLPKSISIRSTGYLQMTRNSKYRVTKPVNVGSHRVVVGVDGAKQEREQKGRDREKGQVVKSMGGLEFEVYSQGMFKTELCNKWEEAGACAYGDQCQFAHGIAELRPVIRHPRYKTQPCRMVIGGAGCPYGHRCHFRHSVTHADHQQLLLRA